MKLSFAEIAGSQAYQTQAAATSKANMTIATVVAVLIMVFAEWGFGAWWLAIIPLLWFVSSLVIAMPFMMLRTAAAAAYSEDMSKARAIGGALDILNYVVVVAATYFGLRFLHRLLFS